MLIDRFREAITKASLNQLPEITQSLWKAVTAEALTWDDAGTLSELLEIRRKLLADRRTGTHRTTRRDRLRVTSEAWTRRRRLAASGPLPPALAAAFTTGELAALRIVLDEVRDRGSCDRTLGEIGGRAGVSIDTVRRAIRQAARMGLVTVEERRRHRQPSLPNVVRVISQEVISWINHHRYQSGRKGGSQDCYAKETKDSQGRQSNYETSHRLPMSFSKRPEEGSSFSSLTPMTPKRDQHRH